MFVNNKWCNPGNISVKEKLCTLDIELLAIGLRQYYLLQEFSHVIALTVYIPPSADAALACELLHIVVSQLQTSHPHSFLMISGEFNHVSLSSILPNFTQYVTCHTRNNKTLHLLYANIKDAYSYLKTRKPFLGIIQTAGGALNLETESEQMNPPPQRSHFSHHPLYFTPCHTVHLSPAPRKLPGSALRVMFFEFSSASNTIQQSLLRGKLD